MTFLVPSGDGPLTHFHRDNAIDADRSVGAGVFAPADTAGRDENIQTKFPTYKSSPHPRMGFSVNPPGNVVQ